MAQIGAERASGRPDAKAKGTPSGPAADDYGLMLLLSLLSLHLIQPANWFQSVAHANGSLSLTRPNLSSSCRGATHLTQRLLL